MTTTKENTTIDYRNWEGPRTRARRERKLEMHRKIATGIVGVLCTIFGMLMNMGIMMVVYKVWFPPFNIFVCWMIISTFVSICVSTLIYSYVRDVIYGGEKEFSFFNY